VFLAFTLLKTATTVFLAFGFSALYSLFLR